MKKRAAGHTRHPLEVPVDNLRWHCNPSSLGIARIEEVTPLQEIIGQDRALRALQVGLDMKHAGYNVFVTGSTGTGRTTTIKQLLHRLADQPASLTDKCYVHNFRDPDSPLTIILPAGQGTAFKKDMASFLAELMKAIPGVFESRRYADQRKSTLGHFQDRQRTVLREFEKRVREKGFEVVQVQGGGGNRPEIAPLIDGNPASMEQMHARVEAGEMTDDDFKKMIDQHATLEKQMDLVMREMRNIERKAKRSLDELNHKIVVPVVEELLEDLRQRYESPRVESYLNDIERSIIDNVARFHVHEDPQQALMTLGGSKDEDEFLEYQVNVIVDNSTVKGVPVVIETNPRYKNLFGTIERVVDRNGVWRSDFTRVKAGSMLKADGGFLVMNALDALSEPGVYTTLKRVLRNRQIEIQSFEQGFFGASSALKPEPIDLNVKVIMIGDSSVYHMLYGLDDDFKKIFKIRADFDSEMTNDGKSISSYLSFIKSLCEREELLPFEVSGAAEVIEYGARLAGQQNKLSTRFSALADVLREASYWASREKAERVNATHVRQAIEERIERYRLIEEKIQEMIMDGSILIDSTGAKVGQVNGLSVYMLGETEFGRPTRITAKTAVGRGGIINIERESAMSGPTHNKGVLILSGYLRSQYAQNKPLVLSASIAFEQSYSGVDGDSASSTEIYAILSSLANLPLRQDLAVTGSVNQHGEIQPIGGVNQKVEGFFDVCNARGLTGNQGVLIPAQNVKDLMLRHDVVDAVRAGKYRIYAITTVDQGIEILTGTPAGVRTSSGKFTPGTVHARVDAVLQRFARTYKAFEG
jgi:lon-related putative ATP-dependent protease